ncbi:MAG: DUF433 domain-containing protein [Bacteroidetes bacterium]|nr:DUF433 domain-containing protein [Bacteroidota bacterium]MBU2584138.1 DUF433 domain-containing protein [Bacteroidota bacterium]
MNNNKLISRITVNPEQCGGRPCIRGMRIRVQDVLDLFASGLSAEQILEELPDLEHEDLHACLYFAAKKLEHPILTV